MPVRTSKCYPLVRGKRFRTTRLDSCGRFVYGDYAVGVTDSIVSVAATAVTTEVEEIRQQNANGDNCVYVPSRQNLEGRSLEITFCKVDPEQFALITGQELYLDYEGNPIGWEEDTQIDLEGHGFGLEVWMGVPGDACDPEEGTAYGYVLFPYIKGGILGDLTMENGAATFVITGATTRNGNFWGVGPYDVMTDAGGDPAPLPTALKSSTDMLPIQVFLDPPDAFCGTRPLLDPEATPLVSVSGEVGESDAPLSVEFTVMPTLVDTGVWYDYGDDTWEYVVGNGDASHVYAEAGTYTVSASTNGTWVTTTVTVPAP